MISKDIVKKKFDAAVVKYASNFQLTYTGINFWKQIYMLMWDEFPHTISLSTDGCYLNTDIDDYFGDNDNEYAEDKNPHFCTFEHISVHKTLISIIEHYKKNIVIYRDGDYPVIIGDHMLIMMSLGEDSDMYIFQNKEYLSDEFASLVVEQDVDDIVDYTYIWCDGSMQESTMSIKSSDLSDIDLETNYNDDLPHDTITDFLKSNESGMVLLHGEAGTGKSAYIKYLIHEIAGRHFIVIDSADVQYITNTGFAQIFSSSKDAVVVIEDNSTDKSSNSKSDQLKNLLSIDGGIIGSNVSYKFICTYNDSAYPKTKIQSTKVKVDYEFKELSAEKTKFLSELYNVEIKEGQTLPLSKIIRGEDNEDEKPDNKHKIGFGK